MALTRGLREQDGIFNDQAQLIGSDLGIGLNVAIGDGVSLQWYKISALDSGGGVLLNNGNYANPVTSPIDNKILSKNVGEPHEIANEDSGFILIFNSVGTALLNIPDGLDYTAANGGVSVIALNIGGGSVRIENTGTDTTRGSKTLTDNEGYMAITKISATLWQSSER